MKKFIVFLILAGAVGAGVYFYDPYLKPYLSPIFAKVTEVGPAALDEETATDAGQVEPVAPNPSPVAPASAPPAAAPAKGTVGSPFAATPAVMAPTPAATSQSEINQLLARKYPMPQILPLTAITNDWSRVPDNAFPTEVTLKERVAFTLKGADGKIIGSSIAVPGTLVQPARFNNPQLTIASLANRAMRTTVNVNATDFKDRIQAKYENFVVNKTAEVNAQREKARKILSAKPEVAAAATANAATPAAWDSAEDPRFEPVKASLVKNDLPSVRPEEATGFRWMGSRKIHGDKLKGTYDTVLVSFKVDTIFGVFPTEWLALLENGKVLGWVDPLTHETSALAQ